MNDIIKRMKHSAIITVVYNNYADLPDLFASLDCQTDTSFQMFISDLSDKPENIKLPAYAKIIRGKNKGYAYGLNMGIDAAVQEGYENFVCMNNDTYVDKNFVASAIKAIKKHPASLIGGKIYYAPGYEYHRESYEKKDIGNVIWYAGGHIDWNHALAVHRGVDEIDWGYYDTEEKTGFVTGCLMVFDKKLIDTAGKMDDSYFLYYEDTEWNERIKRSGCEIWYDPSIVMWHKNAQSTGGSGSKLHETYQRKNQLIFGLKYAPLRTKLHLLKNYVFRK